MSPDKKRGRPAKAAPAVSTTIKTESILAELDEVARHVDGTFVVVVETAGGKYHRRCFLTAAAAERAANRATERGENARVYLAELKPLHRVIGGDRGE